MNLKEIEEQREKDVYRCLVNCKQLFTSAIVNDDYSEQTMEKITNQFRELANSSINLGYRKGLTVGYNIGHGFGKRRQTHQRGLKSKGMYGRLTLE